jgi:hypothetical protein
MYVDSAAYEPRKDHVVLHEPQCAEKDEHCDGLVDRMKARDERGAYGNDERTDQRDELEQAATRPKRSA